MFKPALISAILLLCGFPTMLKALQQPGAAAPAGAAPAADTANLVNPVHPTAASLSRAKQIYGFDCALCHGAEGAGDGDLGTQMKLTMHDFRNPATLKDMTDGQLYSIIDKGKGDMPPEEGRAKPDEIWNLVIYLRSFSKEQNTAGARAPN